MLLFPNITSPHMDRGGDEGRTRKRGALQRSRSLPRPLTPLGSFLFPLRSCPDHLLHHIRGVTWEGARGTTRWRQGRMVSFETSATMAKQEKVVRQTWRGNVHRSSLTSSSPPGSGGKICTLWDLIDMTTNLLNDAHDVSCSDNPFYRHHQEFA